MLFGAPQWHSGGGKASIMPRAPFAEGRQMVPKHIVIYIILLCVFRGGGRQKGIVGAAVA